MMLANMVIYLDFWRLHHMKMTIKTQTFEILTKNILIMSDIWGWINNIR